MVRWPPRTGTTAHPLMRLVSWIPTLRSMIPLIPDDALVVIRAAFSAASRASAERMCRLPNLWETSLDQTFIDALVGWGGPIQVESGWTVRIETHFLGGGRVPCQNSAHGR